MVAGSSPARGANDFRNLRLLHPTLLGGTCQPYVQCMCTLVRVATAKEPFHLLGEVPRPLTSSTGTGADSLWRVFSNYLSGKPHPARACGTLQTELFSQQFQIVNLKTITSIGSRRNAVATFVSLARSASDANRLPASRTIRTGKN
jgi:hypothetical protein